MTEFTEPPLSVEHNRWLDRRRAFAREFAQATGGILLELPMASEETGIHSAIIYPENYDSTLRQVARGARMVSPAVLDNQAASMLRDPSNLEIEDRNDPWERRKTMLPKVSKLEKDVIALAKHPTMEAYAEIMEKAPPAPKSEMRIFLRIIKGYMKKNNLSFPQALYKTHLEAYEGTVGATPYLSLFVRFSDALKYAASPGDGCLLLANVTPDEYLNPDTTYKHPGEMYAYGVLPRKRIHAVILTHHMTNLADKPQICRDAQAAIKFVYQTQARASRGRAWG